MQNSKRQRSEISNTRSVMPLQPPVADENTFRMPRQRSSPITIMCVGFLLLCGAFVTDAFSISMEYRSPVKSSVSKMYDRRMTRSSAESASASTNSRPSSQQGAFAGTYAPETITTPTPKSFEQRMRELALSTQQSRQSKKLEIQRPSVVHVVESLQDYKRVVGDEKERIVVVRFHATWCRVSQLQSIAQ
jgi:hypothetical protein